MKKVSVSFAWDDMARRFIWEEDMLTANVEYIHDDLWRLRLADNSATLPWKDGTDHNTLEQAREAAELLLNHYINVRVIQANETMQRFMSDDS